jgi:hypothetical protein
MHLAKRITAWLKIHPKVFSVTGTLIVLLTFTIKNAWRESVRDDLDDLERKSSLFPITEGLEEAHGDELGRSATHKQLPALNVEFLEDSRQLSQRLDSDNIRIEQMQVMATLLKQQVLDKRNELTNQFQTAIKDDDYIEEEPMDIPGFTSGKSMPVPGNLIEAYKKVMAEEKTVSELIASESAVLSQRVEQRKDELDRTLRRLTRWGIALYVLGAVMTILGTLSDIETKIPG